MTAAVETMAYAGAVPWHGLGEPADEAMTSREAMALGGLDWTVALGPAYGGPALAEIDDLRTVYRTSDQKPLWVVGKRYEPVQNAEVFSFLDSLVQDQVLRYDTVGALHGGRQVWMLARLTGDGLTIAGDAFQSYLLAVNAHDGTSALQVFPTLVRVVCANTLAMALGGRQRGQGVNIHHSGNVQDKLRAAQRLLTIETAAQRRMAEWLTLASETPVTVETVREVQTGLFGSLDDESPALRQHAVARFLDIYRQEEATSGNTAYTLVNAVTGYADHGRPLRGQDKAEARFTSTLIAGGARSMKDRGLALVAEAAGIPPLEHFATAAN